MSDELLVEHGSVLRLTINRPRRRNALTSDLLLDLAGAIEAASADPRVRVIAIHGAGPAFSAGADLNAVSGLTADSARADLAAANRLIRAVVTAPQIVVTLVRGPAAAYGAALAFAADLAIAGEEATFLIPFGKVGLMPDGGATALVATSAGRATAARLALLGDSLSALEASALGLVARVFPADVFDTEAGKIVRSLANGPLPALTQTKRAIRLVALAALDAVLDLEGAEQPRLLLGPDFAEGVAAFQERRPPRFNDSQTSQDKESESR